MGLRIIYGRAGSGKSTLCLNEIKDRLKNDKNAKLVLIIPEQYSLQAEKNLIDMIGGQGGSQAEVLSFRRLAYRVFNMVGGAARKHMSPAGKSMLIQQVLNEMKPRLSVFSNAAEQPGFSGVISKLTSEFKRYSITPDILASAAEMAENDTLFSSKIRELSFIYNGIESKLHEKYIDIDDDLTLLAKKLPSYTDIKGSHIWIDEFSGFTPQEYAVIAELLNLAESVSICLCSDCLDVGDTHGEGTDVFMPSKRTAAKLIKLSKELNIPVEEPVCLQGMPPRFKNSRELAHLEKQYFSYPYKSFYGHTENIEIFCAVNIYTEVEETAKKIIGICRDEGLRFKDIAVGARNLADYEKLISALFREYGIPFFIDLKKDVNSHPLIRMIVSMLKIFIEEWSYDSVFGYLKTGFTGIERQDIDILENYVLACGIKGGKWTQENDWDIIPDTNGGVVSETQFDLVKINSIRKAVAAPLIKFRDATKGRRTVTEFCTALFNFLMDIKAFEQIESARKTFVKQGELGLAGECGQVWNNLIEALDQAAEVLGEASMNIERFHSVFTAGLAEYSLKLIPPSLDQVLVGSLERSKNHNIKVLFIIGANDGVFPAPAGEEGILSDGDRGKLKDIGIELAQDTRSKAFEEQFLVYSALMAPNSRLYLSYPIADHEGRSLRPSPVIARVKKIFPGISERSNLFTEDSSALEIVSAPVPTFNAIIAAMGSGMGGERLYKVMHAAEIWYLNNSEWKSRFEKALSGLAYTSLPEPVKKERTRRLYGMPLYTSVSRLENFSECPFSFFVKYGLNARERKVYSFTAPDMGSFMHNIIDDFSKRMGTGGENWRSLTKEQCMDIVTELVDNRLGKIPNSILNSSGRYKYLAARLKRVLSRAVWLISQHIKRGSFEPVGYELEFSDNGEYPPIVLTLPDGTQVKLTGRIDRLDAFKTDDTTYVRIIDYKSGTKDLKLSDIFYGLKLQLITYLDAVIENNGVPGGVLYFKLDDPILKAGYNLSDEEIENSIMKQLRMKGLLLADVKLIREMDHEIAGDSLIIPARINNNDSLGRASAATLEQFELLRGHVKKLLKDICGRMLDGDVSVSPYMKNRFTPCTYCPYPSVCQFDPKLKENKYRIFRNKEDNEVWKAVTPTEKGGESDAG